MATSSFHPAVDAYIAKAQPFAQPILSHWRELMHKGCPEVEETIKWSRPFFEYRGAILANMSGFKQHCSFAFWGQEINAVLREAGVVGKDGTDALGRITALKDLPPDKTLLGWIRQAAAFVESGNYTSPIAARHKRAKAPRPVLEAPEEFKQALNKNKYAAKRFSAFSPSCQREYIEWIVSAKRTATRDERIAQAVAWIAEGKQRNWKYQAG